MKMTLNQGAQEGAANDVVSDVKQMILGMAVEFRLDTGHSFPMRPLGSRMHRMNPKQKDALVPAFEELTKEGYFEERDGHYYLTEQGRNWIY